MEIKNNVIVIVIVNVVVISKYRTVLKSYPGIITYKRHSIIRILQLLSKDDVT